MLSHESTTKARVPPVPTFSFFQNSCLLSAKKPLQHFTKVDRSQKSFKMQFSTSAVVALMATGALAQAPAAKNNTMPQPPKGTGVPPPKGTGYSNGTVSYVTETVTQYKTYCPYPTTFKAGNGTYTATTSTWVTVACPNLCTITYPAGTYPTTGVAPVGPARPANTNP